MRRLLAIALSLLCIALPLRSIADAVASGKHCPRMQAHVQPDAQRQSEADMHAQHHSDMQADVDIEMESLAATPAETSGDHDCCNDAATFASTGQLCKMGQECSAPVTYLLPPTVLVVAVATQHTVVTTPSTTLHTRPPTAVWRPPSLS